MLSKKFITKYGLNNLGPVNEKTHRTEQVLLKIVTQQFGNFIDKGTFTELSLFNFEEALVKKM